jgi:hypothetical protein
MFQDIKRIKVLILFRFNKIKINLKLKDIKEKILY